MWAVRHHAQPSCVACQVPFFRTQEERCITNVMLQMQPHLFVPDEMICHAGEVRRSRPRHTPIVARETAQDASA